MIEKLLEYSSLIQSKPVPRYKRSIVNQISFDHKLVGSRGAKRNFNLSAIARESNFGRKLNYNLI